MSGSFADSNVLLYLAKHDLTKARVTERLLDEGLTISVQVLNEVANVCIKKFKRPWSDADLLLGRLRAICRVVPVDEDIHDLGISVAKRHRLAIYDSMIIAAALFAGCDTLYSEDMPRGLIVVGRLTIVNPFLV
jgi:predicted nucleic acid-binding protein